MIKLENICLRRGSTILFANVNLNIASGQRLGIIGANGSGKSSLFALLLQQLEADSGRITLSPAIKISHVAQEVNFQEQSALAYVLDGDGELRRLEKALQKAEQTHDGHKIALLHEQLAAIDAYTAPARAAKILNGLGFKPSEIEKSVLAFSGGWQMRLNLARALMTPSDLLLLDEPTNHLDLDAILWLEQWLKAYPGTLLLIAHDRDFLDQTVTTILHVYQQSLKMYSGNYSAFETLRAQALQLQQATYEKQQKKIAHLQHFVERFRYKASKARQAQSRLKAIARLEEVCKVQADSPFQFTFKEPASVANPLLTLEKANLGYANKNILTQVNFSITPSDRIGILGPNGAGKSTFIKSLAGELRVLSGERVASKNLKIGYFSQHRIDQLQLNLSPIKQLQALAPQEAESNLRHFLGYFGFVGDRVFASINHFSGGEKARLALALLVWQRPNLLLLDEPTNHLDLEMRNALSLSLQDFSGGMILISHDRFLMRATVDKLYLVVDGKLSEFAGDMDDYHRWLLNYRDEATKKTQVSNSTNKKYIRQENAKQRHLLQPLQNKMRSLEKEVRHKEEALTKIQVYLADPNSYQDNHKQQLTQSLIEQKQLQKELTRLMVELAQIREQYQQLNK